MKNSIKYLYLLGLLFISLGILLPVLADNGSSFIGMMGGNMNMNHSDSNHNDGGHSMMMDEDHSSHMDQMMNNEECDSYMQNEDHSMMEMMHDEECMSQMDQFSQECETSHTADGIENCYNVTENQ